MRRYNQLFYTFCLLLTVGCLWTYLVFARYFESGWEYQKEAQVLKEQLQEKDFQLALLEYQKKDLEQTVAGIIPTQSNLAKEDRFKDLMKTLRAPASIPTMDMSSTLLEKGKKYFLEGQLDEAARQFDKLKNQFPSSSYQIQARFFLAESYFLRREFKKCVDVIDEMVLQFPDHELTGLILLRLGQISEHNSQIEEAQEIYRTVYENFKQKPIREQARILMKNLEIE